MTDMDKTIVDAFEIAEKTHENIAKLIKRCKSLCKESGYELFKKRGDFLHWFEAAEPSSWSTMWFILLFRRKDNEKNSVYVVEVNLTDSFVRVARFIYPHEMDYDNIRTDDISVYSWPINNQHNKYSVEKFDDFTKITPPQDRKYNFGISHIWLAKFPLSEIKSDNVKEKIFGTFDKLAELDS